MKIGEIIKQGKFRNEYQKAAINFTHTMNVLNYQKEETLSRFNISWHQFNVLRILRGQFPDSVTMNSIKERMIDKNSDVTRIADRMHAKKLLKRTRSSRDRRSVKVLITQKGLDILAELDKKEEGLYGGLKNLSEKEVKKLNAMLEKIWN